MRLEITARHFTMTDSLRTLIEERLGRVLRLLSDSAVSAQVVLTRDRSRFRAEVTLHARGENFLHGEAVGRDARAVASAAAAKIDRQIQKLKGKWTDGRRRKGAETRSAVGVDRRRKRAAGTDGPQAPETPPRVRVIRVRRYAVKPMSVDEAALEVGDGPNAFLVFRNAATETVSILFRRPDGHLALIDPDT